MTHAYFHTLYKVAEESTTRVIRRLEIYEADGATLWMPSEKTPRLVSGDVTVDYDRDERRAVDCVLDNQDGILKHDPNGFWYDKILKMYRGFEYDNPESDPAIAIVADTSSVLLQFLRQLGFSNITVIPNTEPWDVDSIRQFDVVAGAHWSSTDMDRIKVAFEAGVRVLQIGFIGTVDPPFILTKETQSSTLTGLKTFTKPAVDTPIANGWGTFTSSATTQTGHFIRTLQPGVISALRTTQTGNPVHNAVLYEIPETGQKWVYYKNLEHLQEATVNPNVIRLFRNALAWLGVAGELVTYEKQIGEFMIDRIDQGNFPSLIKVTGRDYAKKLLGDKFLYSTTFNAGIGLDTVVKAIASNGGITKFALGAGGKSLGTTITFDRLTTRWAAIKELCNVNSIEVFFNAEGYLVTRPMLDPVISPVAFILKTGSDGNLNSYKKSSNDARIFNIVVVSGENSDVLAGGVIVGAYVENNEPNSPTRVSRIGRRTFDYSSALFTTNQQCWEYATTMLGIKALEQFDLSFSSIYYPWTDVGEIVRFEDPEQGEDEPSNFLLTTLSLPVALGPMTGGGKRITIVGYAEDRGITIPADVDV
jgi:hypothetical protein